MRSLIIVGSLVLGMGLTAACVTAQKESQAKKTKFETIAKGFASGLTRAQRKVVATAKDWEALWKEHASVQAPAPATPKVDFAKQVVIVVTMGEKPTAGYGVEVTRIKQTKNALVVHFKETKPAPDAILAQVLTQPYHIIRLDKPKGKVRFVKEAGKE